VWVPKSYSGSYGNNGFYLSFADSSAIGDDLSGNTNDFTANNLAASDVVNDSPTNNHCVMNPLDSYNSGSQLSDGNLKSTGAGQNGAHCGTHSFDIANDKFYWEITTVGTNSWLGIVSEDFSGAQKSGNVYASAGLHVVNTANGHKSQNPYASSTAFMSSMSANDVLGIACGEGNIEFFINGVSQGDAYTGLTGRYKPFAMSATTAVSVFNFGQTSFSYSAPTDYLSLNSENMPEPTIGPNSGVGEQSDDYFNTVLYTGDGTSSNAITGVGFQSDFLWIKQRDATRGHQLMDSVRGASVRLQSHGGTPESASALVSFDSDGFTVDGTTLNGTNISGGSFVGWCWKGGGTAVSNTDGSITSSVSANQDAGFSIVTWDAVGNTTGTVGHGLSVAPDLIIGKGRDASTNWFVMETNTLSANQVLNLDSNGAAYNPGYNHFNDTFPTASVFSIGGYLGAHADLGSNTDKLAYCFHSVEGYSKVGSYTGNGNADGTFIFTGHRVTWLMVKRSDSTGWWGISDSARSPYNEIANTLAANEAYSESTLTSDLNVDFLSNGFKIRDTDGYYNASGGTYIYLAFAEAPFKYANAR